MNYVDTAFHMAAVYLTLNAHVPEGYISHLVCQSVDLSASDFGDCLVLCEVQNQSRQGK